MLMNFSDLTLIALSAILGACLVFGAQGLWRFRPRAAAPDDIRIVFLFQENVLVDATADALALIEHKAPHMTEFCAMLEALSVPFPGLEMLLSQAKFGSSSIQSAVEPSLRINVERDAKTIRVLLKTPQSDAKEDPLRTLIEKRQQSEIALLRHVSHHAPQLIWQTSGENVLTWANKSFLDFAQDLGADGESGHAQTLANLLTPAKGGTADQHRVAIKPTGGEDEYWFDVTTVNRNDCLLHFGTDANAVMRADAARRGFVKTLGKTFAQLSTGLAIFDKDRRLTMFNPALLEMTNLPVDFLSVQPTIDTVLDRLRESRMMPEPRDYSTWRDQFAAVEDAAKKGTYSANWALPDGQTLRVTGKPHPDGAFAFLFEDISAELSLTRRFRTDIETGQAVLDNLPEAVAVFSAAGTLVMSNRAYARLWETKTDLMLEHREMSTEMSVWQNRCLPTPMWDEMNAFITRVDDRKTWSDDAMLDDGRNLRCHATPISGGTTLVRFTIAPMTRPMIRSLAPQQPRVQLSKG